MKSYVKWGYKFISKAVETEKTFLLLFFESTGQARQMSMSKTITFVNMYFIFKKKLKKNNVNLSVSPAMLMRTLKVIDHT